MADDYQQLRNMAVQSSGYGVIDKATESVAKMLCREERFAPDAAFTLNGGGFIPAWTMYVSEATKLIKSVELRDDISSNLKEWRKK